MYAAALAILFRQAGLNARKEHCVDILFHGERIASYRLDFMIEDVVILELKAGAALAPGAKSQLLTYLRSARKEVGLLLYFGPTPEVSRVVL